MNKLQPGIPKGFAYGFLTLSDIAEVQYKTTENWFKEYEKGIIERSGFENRMAY